MASTASNLNTQVHQRVAVVFSPGIRKIRHLCQLADVDIALSPAEARRQNQTPTCVLVWGRKSNTAAALKYASEYNLEVHYLEDGWIRSSSSNPHSRISYSMLKDKTGVYYDSRTTNDLENFLNLSRDEFLKAVSDDQLEYARKCRTQLVGNNITKYNYTSTHLDIGDLGSQKRVLVVDQTRDDASVLYGGMDAEKFEAMLRAAIDENPEARIIVRIHPDVVSGKREGYLKDLSAVLGVDIEASSLNPILLLKQVDLVYVGTSQLGYEALLCDKPVTVFGEPFYAGWGLTDDRASIPRRVHDRTIDEMFYATHVAFARYCNPVTGDAWHLHECLAHVELQQQMFKRNAKHFECIGITPWKRKYIKQYLRSPDGTVTFKKSTDSHNAEGAIENPDKTSHQSNQASKGALQTPNVKLTWSYRAYGDIKPSENQAVQGVPLFRMEDGFLRGAGLGSDFNAPASLVVDGQGLYFDPSRISDLEELLLNYECSPFEIFRSVALKKLILSSRLSKYNVGRKSSLKSPKLGSTHILVVGQVEDDQSIQRGCEQVNKNAELLIRVRQAKPDAWIRYKPHPDVVAGNRKGSVDDSVLRENADAVDAEASIIDCIDACDELHTMTSLSGFEALLRGKRVVTYGAPFYAGWGLTEDHQPIARRTRSRTLDELLYLAYIEYPRYIDIETGEFTTPEDLVRTIISQRAMNRQTASGLPAKKIKILANIVRGLRYAP